MLRKLLVFLVTSGLAAKAVQRLTDRRRIRAVRNEALDRPAVRRWESEGGAIR